MDGKYQDLEMLKQNMEELHKMFLDFQMLAQEQGELCNHIETRFVLCFHLWSLASMSFSVLMCHIVCCLIITCSVTEAREHVEIGNGELCEAIEIKKKARKQQILLSISIAVVLLIAMLLLYLFRI